jgi:hypothetical protein
MPDQLLTYYVENPLVITSINSSSLGVMVIGLDIEIWEIGKGGNKRGSLAWDCHSPSGPFYFIIS